MEKIMENQRDELDRNIKVTEKMIEEKISLIIGECRSEIQDRERVIFV